MDSVLKNGDKLSFEQLKNDMKVKDIFGNIGIIKDISDIHNIRITYPKGEYALFCLQEGCEDFGEPDSLYYYEN